MKQLKARQLLGAIFGRDDDAAVLSRRTMLAGLGLVGAAVAATQLVSASTAEAKPLAQPVKATDETKASDRTERAAPEAEVTAESKSEATDLSSQYYWRRRRRRYWVVRRRYYWRRRRYWW